MKVYKWDLVLLGQLHSVLVAYGVSLELALKVLAKYVPLIKLH
jgi:hypothetical protein